MYKASISLSHLYENRDNSRRTVSSIHTNNSTGAPECVVFAQFSYSAGILSEGLTLIIGPEETVKGVEHIMVDLLTVLPCALT